jgi:protein-L-isoaspartate(D-aspartate) O-methyltransferase
MRARGRQVRTELSTRHRLRCRPALAQVALAVALLGIPVCPFSCARHISASRHTGQARERLVIAARANGVSDERVLDALRAVPREEFVPFGERAHAYEDRSLPIERGQKISQPSLVALMTQLLKISRGDKVLEIGTGSGYQAAILAELAPRVYSVEIIPEMANTARKRLRRLGYRTVQVRTGDGYQGWPEHAPFDSIIVTCAPDHVPEPLVEQLKEGGRMVIPVGPESDRQTLYLLEKQKGRLRSTRIVPVKFVPLVH